MYPFNRHNDIPLAAPPCDSCFQSYNQQSNVSILLIGFKKLNTKPIQSSSVSLDLKVPLMCTFIKSKGLTKNDWLPLTLWYICEPPFCTDQLPAAGLPAGVQLLKFTLVVHWAEQNNKEKIKAMASKVFFMQCQGFERVRFESKQKTSIR